MNHSIWEKNHQILQRRWPQIAHAAENLPELPLLSGAPSRDGHWVWQLDNGQAVHSMYAPKKESQRFCDSCEADAVLFLGFGCGYQILPFLAGDRFCRLLIVESSLAHLKGILTLLDQEEILNDPRVELACFPQVDDFADWLATHYHPLWHGQLINYPLRALLEKNRPYYESILAQLSAYFHALSGDLSSQAFFAKTWFHNILTNLWSMGEEEQSWQLPEGKGVLLAGAGPSLEQGLNHLAAARKKGYVVIACDAALRPLLQAGIIPDVVMSLDAQPAVVRHFVGIQDAVLLCDIASPPSLARKYKAHFFAGGHPLSQMCGLTALDTQGGNVGYTALVLAKRLYPEVIGSYGFDFCFPQAKPYARGVYVYPEFLTVASRLLPYESQVLHLVYRYRNLNHSTGKKQGEIVYTPDLFIAYQQNFQRLLQAQIPSGRVLFSSINGQEFVLSYKKKILDLPMQAWRNPNAQQHDMYMTLAPLTAYFVGQNLPIAQAWQHALIWAKDFLQNWDESW